MERRGRSGGIFSLSGFKCTYIDYRNMGMQANNINLKISRIPWQGIHALTHNGSTSGTFCHLFNISLSRESETTDSRPSANIDHINGHLN